MSLDLDGHAKCPHPPCTRVEEDFEEKSLVWERVVATRAREIWFGGGHWHASGRGALKTSTISDELERFPYTEAGSNGDLSGKLCATPRSILRRPVHLSALPSPPPLPLPPASNLLSLLFYLFAHLYSRVFSVYDSRLTNDRRDRDGALSIKTEAARREGGEAVREKQGGQGHGRIDEHVHAHGLHQRQRDQHPAHEHVRRDEPGGPQRDGEAPDCDGSVRALVSCSSGG